MLIARGPRQEIHMKYKMLLFVFMLAFLLVVPVSNATNHDCENIDAEGNVVHDSTCEFIRSSTTKVNAAFQSVFGWIGAGTCDPPGGWLDFAKSEWLAPIGLVLFILVMIYTLVYLFGIFLQSPNIIAIAKEEFFQIGITFLRVTFIIVVMSAATQWYSMNIPAGTTDVVYMQAPTYIDASIVFSELLVKDMTTNFFLLISYNMVIHTLFSATMWFGVTWRAMFSFNLGPVLKPLIDILGFSMQFLSVGIGEWVVHITTMCMIKKWTFSIFIPIGMLMRSIPPIRGAGDAFIALVFSFSLFYPFMFIVNYEIYKLMGCNVYGGLSSFGNGISDYCGAVDPNSPIVNFVRDYGGLGIFGIFWVLLLFMGGVFIPFFLTGALSVAFELIKASVFFIVIMSLILPLINIFITLTSARETARFFNVDINFFAFVRLI